MDFFGRRMMMKKLLALLLVFSMSSVAGAALHLSVGGNTHPIDSEIILLFSETISIDIWSDMDITGGGEGEGQLTVAVDTSIGSLSGGIVVPDPVTGQTLMLMDDAVNMVGVTGLPPGYNGVYGAIFTTGDPIAAGTIFDEIVFHCEMEPDDATIILYSLDSFGQVNGEWDRVIIHQPEPMTVALLGLGGLFLLRRRR
jgi:hypothetical protein